MIFISVISKSRAYFFCIFNFLIIVAFLINISIFFWDGRVDNIEIWSGGVLIDNITIPFSIFSSTRQWAMPHFVGPVLISLFFGVVFIITVSGVSVADVTVQLQRNRYVIIKGMELFPKVVVEVIVEEEDEESEEMGVLSLFPNKIREDSSSHQGVDQVSYGPTKVYKVPILPERWPMLHTIGFWRYFFSIVVSSSFEKYWEIVEIGVIATFGWILLSGGASDKFGSYWSEASNDLVMDLVQADLGALLGTLILILMMPFPPSPLLWVFKNWVWKIVTVLLVLLFGGITFLGVVVKHSTVFGLFPTPIQWHIGFYAWYWLSLLLTSLLWSIDIYTVPEVVPLHYPTIADRDWFYIYVISLLTFFHIGVLDLRINTYICTWVTVIPFFAFTFLLSILYKRWRTRGLNRGRTDV